MNIVWNITKCYVDYIQNLRSKFLEIETLESYLSPRTCSSVANTFVPKVLLITSEFNVLVMFDSYSSLN